MILPIDSDTRRWIDYRTSWIIDQFGMDRIRNGIVVLPDSELVNNYYPPSESSLSELFEAVCNQLAIESGTVDLKIFQERPPVFGETTALGLYEMIDGRHCVSIEESLLHTPQELIAVLAHELCHVLLLGHNRITADEHDHEPLTDLLTVYLGFGIFTSNSVIYQESFRDGNQYSWSMGRRGYLTMPMYGYAWALFASIRNDNGGLWKPHLRLDVRDAFKKCTKLLADDREPDFSESQNTQTKPQMPTLLQNDLAALNENQLTDEDLTRCSFCNEKLKKNTQSWVCKRCQASIEENHREMVEDYDEYTKYDKYLVTLMFICMGVIFLVCLFRLFVE
jgi:hypothetical protein